jgi:hypothetical protein
MPPKRTPPKCKKCNSNITPIRDRGITCSQCEFWYHQHCSGLTLDNFEELYRDKTPHWFCADCIKKKRDRRSSFIVPKPSAPPSSAPLVPSSTSAVSIEPTDSSVDSQNFIQRLDAIEQSLSEEREKVVTLNQRIEELENLIKNNPVTLRENPQNHHTEENFLEIRNLPLHSLVNPTATAIDIGSALGCVISETDVVCKALNESKGVLELKFHSLEKRANFLEAGKKFNREGQRFVINDQNIKIFVNEKLSSAQKRLHHRALTVSKANGFKFCWWCKGQLYVKRSEFHPPTLIKDERSLEEFFTDLVLSECERVAYQVQPGPSGSGGSRH